MVTLSWSWTAADGSSAGVMAAEGAPSSLSSPKDVAEAGPLGNPFSVSEARAGMMVTPSVKLVRPLGEGGMGAVWVADHLALRTQVVVKFIAAGLKDSKDATERFSREAAAAAQVKSPHVVQTFDHGITEDGTPYIVMELLEGRDLGSFLDDEGRCSPELVVAIVGQLARALDRAHERGIIHRDIKPGNIFLCDGGNGEVFVKLLDFGIAKGVDVPLLDSGTKTGAMIGSPFYMSPEQILGSKNIDHRSDLWSLGVVAYETLTGEKPFDAETMGGLAIRIHSEPLPMPSQKVPSLSPAVDAWFLRACSRAVGERFSTAKEMAEALAAALGGEVPRSADLPRSGTGPRPGPRVDEHEPTFAAGATTEAGIVRTTSGATTRNRVLTLLGVCALLGFGAFVAVRALPHRGSSKDAPTLTSDPASARTNVVPPEANKVDPVPSGTPDPSALPSLASSAPSALPGAHAGSRKPWPPSTRGITRAVASSTSGSPPLTSATTAPPAPANTGHDIF